MWILSWLQVVGPRPLEQEVGENWGTWEKHEEHETSEAPSRVPQAVRKHHYPLFCHCHLLHHHHPTNSNPYCIIFILNRNDTTVNLLNLALCCWTDRQSGRWYNPVIGLKLIYVCGFITLSIVPLMGLYWLFYSLNSPQFVLFSSSFGSITFDISGSVFGTWVMFVLTSLSSSNQF